MDPIWYSGVQELLQHADSHRSGKSPFDNRIAFISIDNAIELAFRTYLALPARVRGSPKYRSEGFDVDDASFSELIEGMESSLPSLFDDIPALDLEHYHRIRNRLYHDGSGLTVGKEKIDEFHSIGVQVLERLFGATYAPTVDRLANLRPEALSTLRAEVAAQRRARHGDLVRQGLKEARVKGRYKGRGKITTGLTDEEGALAQELYLQKWGYKRIAEELTKRRRRQRGDPTRASVAVASQKVRRKLIDLGVVKPVGERNPSDAM